MPPVNVTIPHIRNFNPELSSGVVVIKTSYDGIILDESGSSDTNRKALTGVIATTLSFNTFTFYPKTEG
jgi:hypothetical protein